jgi:hypothetical protein
MKEKLFKQIIVSDPFCPLCRLELESSSHFLWYCVASITVCVECNRWIQKSVIEYEDFLTIFDQLRTRVTTLFFFFFLIQNGIAQWHDE